MMALSAAVFLFQRLVAVFLDPIFEACVFHIPALVAAVIYLRMRNALKNPTRDSNGK